MSRQAIIKRETKETNISLELNIDGSGKCEVNTGISMFDHLLEQVARHGASSARELCANVRHDLGAHRNGRARKDDLTLLVVKFAGIRPQGGG